jgi:hypothetical protein
VAYSTFARYRCYILFFSGLIAGFSLCHCGDLSPMALATGAPPTATPESRAKNSIRMLPNVDADLRRRQVEELANLPNWFSAIVDGRSASTVLSQQKQRGHWNDIWPRTA